MNSAKPFVQKKSNVATNRSDNVVKEGLKRSHEKILPPSARTVLKTLINLPVKIL